MRFKPFSAAVFRVFFTVCFPTDFDFSELVHGHQVVLNDLSFLYGRPQLEQASDKVMWCNPTQLSLIFLVKIV
jgi:hypothetical protein